METPKDNFTKEDLEKCKLDNQAKIDDLRSKLTRAQQQQGEALREAEKEASALAERATDLIHRMEDYPELKRNLPGLLNEGPLKKEELKSFEEWTKSFANWKNKITAELEKSEQKLQEAVREEEQQLNRYRKTLSEKKERLEEIKEEYIAFPEIKGRIETLTAEIATAIEKYQNKQVWKEEVRSILARAGI